MLGLNVRLDPPSAPLVPLGFTKAIASLAAERVLVAAEQLERDCDPREVAESLRQLAEDLEEAERG